MDREGGPRWPCSGRAVPCISRGVPSAGFFHGVRTIVSEEGFSGIYHGLSPTILKVATAQAWHTGHGTLGMAHCPACRGWAGWLAG